MYNASNDENRKEPSATEVAPALNFAGSASARNPLMEKQGWTCPMHPEILRDAPGACPLCGMALQAQATSQYGSDFSRLSLAEAKGPARSPFRIPVWLGACLFSAIALYFLWDEHRVHILSALPYVLLLSCPLIHLFMHGGHGHHHGHAERRDSARGDAP